MSFLNKSAVADWFAEGQKSSLQASQRDVEGQLRDMEAAMRLEVEKVRTEGVEMVQRLSSEHEAQLENVLRKNSAALEQLQQEVEKKVAKEVERQVAAHFDVAMEKLKAREEQLRGIGETLQASADAAFEQLNRRVDTRLRDLERAGLAPSALDEIWEALKRLEADSQDLDGKLRRAASADELAERLKEVERAQVQRFDERLATQEKRMGDMRLQLQTANDEFLQAINRRCEVLEKIVWEGQSEKCNVETVFKRLAEAAPIREMQDEINACNYEKEVVDDLMERVAALERQTAGPERREKQSPGPISEVVKESILMQQELRKEDTEERLAGYEQDLFDLREQVEAIMHAVGQPKLSGSKEIMCSTPSDLECGSSLFNSPSSASPTGWLQVTNLAEEVEALRRQVTEGEHAQKVEHLEATVRELQDIHEDLKKKVEKEAEMEDLKQEVALLEGYVKYLAEEVTKVVEQWNDWGQELDWESDWEVEETSDAGTEGRLNKAALRRLDAERLHLLEHEVDAGSDSLEGQRPWI